jgi:hypothetical protein
MRKIHENEFMLEIERSFSDLKNKIIEKLDATFRNWAEEY